MDGPIHETTAAPAWGRLSRRRFLAAAAGCGAAWTAGTLLGGPWVSTALAVAPLEQRPLPIESYLRIPFLDRPAFSPDERRLLYRSTESGMPQLWTLDLESGEAEQLTFSPEPVDFGVYSPTGRALVYSADAGGDENWQFYWLDLDSGEAHPLTDAPGVHHRFGAWSRDGRRIFYTANYRDPTSLDLYVQEVPDGARRAVLERERYSYLASSSPDGEGLILAADTTTEENHLLLLHLPSGDVRQLTPRDEGARYVDVGWPGARSGRYLILVTDHGRDRATVAELDLVYGTLRPLVDSEWEVETARLAFDRPWLAWVANEDGYSVLHVRDQVTGRELPLPELPNGVIGALRWQRGGRLAFTFSGYSQPQGIWRLDVSEQTAEPLLSPPLQGIPTPSFLEPELVRYRSFDGLEVPAFLYLPRGRPAGRRLPVVVSVHGGPSSQSRPNFSALTQYFVQRGWAVFVPNVRGSTGYGKRYVHLDDREGRMDAVADLQVGWHWLVDTGVADPRRVALMGGSYGGYMVLAALTTYPELWAAGVDLVGIANFVTFIEGRAPYSRHYLESEFGSLEQDAAFLRAVSPIQHADRIRAPLLVVQGANDPRVHVGESEQIVASLRERGAPVEYLRFEDEGHTLLRQPNRLTAYGAIARFLGAALDR
jgi:dipeptidyl aminopeptidase/acylaminoacyl peptidase